MLVISCFGVTHLLQKNQELSPIADLSKFAVSLFSENPSSCFLSMNSGFMTCIISTQIYANSSIPQKLERSIYAVADGSVYQADTSFSSTSIDTYNDVLNPNETKNSVLAFYVPAVSTITDIFVANNGSISPADSIFDLKLSVAAFELAFTSDSGLARHRAISQATLRKLNHVLILPVAHFGLRIRTLILQPLIFIFI